MEKNKILNQINGATMIVLSLDDLRNVVQEMVGNAPTYTPVEPLSQDLDKLLSTEEVCEILKVSRVTLYRWYRTGYLVPHKIGKRNMYKLCDINKLH